MFGDRHLWLSAGRAAGMWWSGVLQEGLPGLPGQAFFACVARRSCGLSLLLGHVGGLVGKLRGGSRRGVDGGAGGVGGDRCGCGGPGRCGCGGGGALLCVGGGGAGGVVLCGHGMKFLRVSDSVPRVKVGGVRIVMRWFLRTPGKGWRRG